MKNIKFPVYFTTFLLFAYAAAANLGAPDWIIVSIYSASPFLVIWMAIRVLKDGEESTKTFDEYFYEDYDYKRAGSENEQPEYKFEV